METKEFCKNWLEEMRGQVQPTVQAGSRKRPTVTVIMVGEDEAAIKKKDTFLSVCKQLNVVGELYNIPVDAIENERDITNLLEDVESDGVYLVEPFPLDINECKWGIMERRQDINGLCKDGIFKSGYSTGVLKFAISQNITPGIVKVQERDLATELWATGWTVNRWGDSPTVEEFLGIADGGLLEACGLAQNLIKSWEMKYENS